MGEVRHGHGTYTYASEQSLYKEYSGQWRNNKKHGFGLLLMRDGSAYAGQWEENQRHGVGVCFSYGESGAQGPGSMPTNRYEGEWAKDKKNGLGVEEDKNYFYCGIFENGERAKRGLRMSQAVSGVLGCQYLDEAPSAAKDTWCRLVDRLQENEELGRIPAVS